MMMLIFRQFKQWSSKYTGLISDSLLAEAVFLVFADGRKRPLPWVENGYIEHAPRLSDRADRAVMFVAPD